MITSVLLANEGFEGILAYLRIPVFIGCCSLFSAAHIIKSSSAFYHLLHCFCHTNYILLFLEAQTKAEYEKDKSKRETSKLETGKLSP